MPALGIGLVGCGVHGVRYRDHLARGDVDGLRLVALCRRDRTRGAAQAAEVAARYAPSVEDLLAGPDVDAVVVASSPAEHAHAVAAALAAGKPVLVEKPVVLDVAAGRALLADAARHAHVPVMAAQTLRYDAFFAGVAAAARDVGRVQHVELTSARPGLAERVDRGAATPHRALYDIAVHPLDWAATVVPGPFKDAVAIDRLGDGREVLLALAGDGFVFHLLLLLHGAVPVLSARVVGERGVVEADGLAHRATLRDARGAREVPLAPAAPTLVPTLAAFRDLARGGPNPIPLADGVRAVALAEACLRSLGSRRLVEVEPVR